MMGILMFIVAAAMAIFFVFKETPPPVRVVVFFPFFLSMMGFFQGKARTCVIFAYRNIRDLGAGQEKVDDPEAANLLRIKSQKIIMQAFFLSLVLTAICVVIR